MIELHTTRAAAASAGAVRYRTGKPCLRSHLSDRFTSTGQCVDCVNQYNSAWKKRNPEKAAASFSRWLERKPKPPARPSISLSSRERNRRYRLKKRGFENANPDIYCIPIDQKVRWAIYYEAKRGCIAAKQREYRERRRDLLKQAWADWYSKNRVSQIERAAMRRKKVLDATPSWLTDDDRRKISDIYATCVMVSKQTEIEHHVDHIVPIAGKAVCGLHVPWNLRVIPAAENLKKGNALDPSLGLA